MREVEADLLDRLIQQIHNEFGRLDFLEIGVFGGGTVTGVVKRCQSIECPVTAAGVDFASQEPHPPPMPSYAFFDCDSMDAWRQIVGRFNFLFVDGCHCINHAMCDFLNYSPMVVKGGYCLFHDTALPTFDTKQEEWPQDHSYAGKPDSILGVRDGLHKLGLLQGYRTDWKLIEELPSDTGLMGMMLFQKIADL